MEQKSFIGLTGVLAVIGVGLLVTAFATDNWVSSDPIYRYSNPSNSTTPTTNTTDSTEMEYHGSSTFGIFKGKQLLNFPSGPKSYGLTAVCDPAEGLCMYVFMKPVVTDDGKQPSDTLAKAIANSKTQGNDSQYDDQNPRHYGLFSFSLWLSTSVFLSVSILLGLVTIGFSLYNVFGRPIETITGPMGLYLWNALALVFTITTLAVFGALFITQLSVNFLMIEDYTIGWRSEGYTQFDFSFYLVIGAGVAFTLNFVVLCLSGQTMNCNCSSPEEKEVNNDMILY